MQSIYLLHQGPGQFIQIGLILGGNLIPDIQPAPDLAPGKIFTDIVRDIIIIDIISGLL